MHANEITPPANEDQAAIYNTWNTHRFPTQGQFNIGH